MENQKEEKILSAYEKAAEEGIDPRCIPQRLEGPVPVHDEIPYPDYPESPTPEEAQEYLKMAKSIKKLVLSKVKFSK